MVYPNKAGRTDQKRRTMEQEKNGPPRSMARVREPLSGASEAVASASPPGPARQTATRLSRRAQPPNAKRTHHRAPIRRQVTVMPQRSRDLNQYAASIIGHTSQGDLGEPFPASDFARQAGENGRLLGLKGAGARAENLSGEQRSDIARNARHPRWTSHG